MGLADRILDGETMKRAWRTELIGIRSIVAAISQGEARSITLRCSREANYQAKFTDVIALRAKEHDAWAAVDATGNCWDESLLLKVGKQ